MDGKKIAGAVGGILAFVVAFAVSSRGVQGLFGSPVEKKIQSMATELNKKMPMQIDEVTRCDRVEAGPGKRYAYIYTVSAIPTEAQKSAIRQDITNNVKSSKEMKPIFDAGVTVTYRYYDTNGKRIFEFDVTP